MTRLLLILILALFGCQGNDQRQHSDSGQEPPAAQESVAAAEEPPTDVVFVCQHGYAKSLVSSRHFERMAAERGLRVRAIARGITPSDGVPEPLAAALRGDGFEVSEFQPQAPSADELAEAEYVVSFGNEVPPSPGASRKDWGDVSALSEDYSKAKGEIVDHLTQLLDEIEARGTEAG